MFNLSRNNRQGETRTVEPATSYGISDRDWDRLMAESRQHWQAAADEAAGWAAAHNYIDDED